MEESLPVSRRALIAASTATALGVVASVANAEKADREVNQQSMNLRITLTDGETVTLKATQVIIDFGGNKELVFRPNGLDANNGKKRPSDLDSDDERFNAPRKPVPSYDRPGT